MQCQLCCQQPVIEEECGSEKPAKLMQDFIAVGIVFFSFGNAKQKLENNEVFE